MQAKNRTPSATDIQRYKQQLLEQYQLQAPLQTLPQDNDWLDKQYPMPNFTKDREAITFNHSQAAIVTASPAESSPAIPESTYVGYLRIFAYTGGEAEPIPDTLVTITRSEDESNEIFAVLRTNNDGITPIIPLPSVDPKLTLRPNTNKPYTLYDVRVSKEGFGTSLYERVPIYGNNYVTQPTALFPLLPGEDPNHIRRFVSNGPSDL